MSLSEAMQADSALAAAETAPDDVAFGDVLGILSRRKRWVFGLPLVLLCAAAAYSVVAKPSYTTSAQIYVDPRDRPLPKEQQLNTVPGDGVVLVESQLKLITSDEVLSRVAEKLKLKDDPEFGRASGLLGLFKGLSGQKSANDPELTALRTLRTKTAAKRIDRSYVIDVLASAETPEKATAIANELAQTYLASLVEADDSFNKKTSAAINSRLEDLRQAVLKSENEVEAFRSANGLVGPRAKMVTAQQLDEANTQLTAAKTKLADAHAKLQQLEQARRNGSLDTLPEAISSATIAQLRAQAAAITRDEALLSQQYGPAHPSLMAVKAQKRDIDMAISAEISRIAQSARSEASRAQANVSALQASFDTLKSQQVANDKAMVPLRELERKAEANRSIYEAFLAKAKTAQESEGINTNNARLISMASLPEQKSWPPTAILLAGAGFGGLTLGIALALITDALKRRKVARRAAVSGAAAGFRGAVSGGASSTSAGRVVTPLAAQGQDFAVPVTALAESGVPAGSVASGAVSAGVAQRRDNVQTLIQDMSAGRAGQVIAVTHQTGGAALPLLLAEAMRDAGKVVLLIDADRQGQALSRHFGFAERPGLEEIVQGSLSIYDAARYHRASQLNIVPAGLPRGGAGGEAERDALARAIQAARDFDSVIMDCGEAGQAAQGLLALADETIVASGSLDAASEALVQSLQNAGLKARLVSMSSARAAA